MTDLATRTQADNAAEFTVSELSLRLKKTVEDSYGWVRVRGEVSGLKRAGSGHLYLTLKDADACLDAVCWKGTAGRLAFRPEDGLEVVCTGRLTTYPSRSRYQLVIDRMEPAGAGALMALLDERRRRLAAEGLFDADRKRPLPWLPEVIGVITSPSGAVIRDILHRLRDRFPRRVLVWPVLVQGEQAAAQVAAAIEGFNRLPAQGAVPRPDVLIVARGGGSLEDLWAFNEEVVVRAAAASSIPLISAVGHESDTTLIDHAADRRAPTPTAAAEMAVPVRAEVAADVADHGRRLERCMLRQLDARRDSLRGLARALPDPRRLLGAAEQRLDDVSEHLRQALAVGLGQRQVRLERVGARLRRGMLDREIGRHGRDLERLRLRLARAFSGTLRGQRERLARQRQDLDIAGQRLEAAWPRLTEAARHRLAALSGLLESLSYARVLERGYAVVRAEGRILGQAGAVSPGQGLEIEFRDGRVRTRAEGAGSAPPSRPTEASRPAAPAKSRPVRSGGREGAKGGQGSLF